MRNEASIDEGSSPARSEAVQTVELDGEAVLLDEATNRLHLLNATATLVWACFDGIATVGDIVTDLCAELGQSRDAVLADTLGVTRHLADEGLLAGFEASRWRRRPDVLWRRSLEAVVVLAPRGAEPFTLAGTGPEVWDLLDEERSLEELAGLLASAHDAEAAIVSADLAPIVDELVAAGVVEQVDG